ncbi:apolipoprotein N-acyltransferase [Rathayibacter soli]|uniref:apolipoprotein N-acyltransferase n=1 Tax=Rathayibacter soli TaxID=3144168 RepID=UPI0027E413F5|nr:apolipoprotein N-acyltransferase [Glaciibacter superstes]
MTPARRALLPTWLALIVAVIAAPLLDAGFPDQNVWPLTFVGIGLVLITLIGRRAGAALTIGIITGVAFYLIHVSWTALYLGPLPWIALAVLEGLFFMVGSLTIALAYRWVPLAWPSKLARLGLLPVVIAGLWTAREAIASVWPYGGFAWGRMALSQSESPFAPLVAWFGVSGLTFVMVWLVAFLVACAVELRTVEIGADSVRGRPPTLGGSARGVLAVGAVALVLAIPAWPATTSGTVDIGAVQGNGPAGYFQDAAPGEVMNAQTSATIPLIGKHLDMVVWPEGAADVDPTRDAASAQVLNELSRQLKAPLIVGTITHRDGKYFNSSLLWKADKGAVAIYDKKHPVPFGEYVPDRAFWEPFAPSLIGLIQRDYTPGTRSNVFDVNGIKAGISICFDIADDQLLTEMMDGGAQVILAQTNNADFGRTKENVQQLAIARLRAIEAGRSLVNISTVGTSQIIAPNGATLAEIPAYKPGAMVAAVPLGTATTPATLLSRGIEWLVSGLGVAGLLIAAFASRPSRAERTR